MKIPPFSRFEYVRDNFGNTWLNGINQHNYILTLEILKPGDILKLTASGNDPANGQLYYSFRLGLNSAEVWQTQPEIAILIKPEHIKASIAVYVKIRNDRGHYANGAYDSAIEFRYTVSP